MTAMISHLQKQDKVSTIAKKRKEVTHRDSRIFVFPDLSPIMQVWRGKLTTENTDSLELKKKKIYSS